MLQHGTPLFTFKPAVSLFVDCETAQLARCLRSLVRPRIDQQHTGRREVLGIPGHDMKAVTPCCSGDQAVACGNNLAGFLRGGCEFSPSMAGLEIDGQDSVGVITFEGLQPRLEVAFGLALLEKGNPFGDFSNGYDTDKQIVAFESVNRAADTGMPFGTAQFRKHAGIEQHSQSFISRMGKSSRVRSSFSKLGPSPSRNSLKPGRLPVSFS
jgi:hypothetical protein